MVVLKQYLDTEIPGFQTLTLDGTKLRSIYKGDLSLNQMVELVEGDIFRIGKHMYEIRALKLHKLTTEVND